MDVQSAMDKHAEGELENKNEHVVGFMNQMQSQFNDFIAKAQEG